MVPRRIAPALTVLTLMTSLPPSQTPVDLHSRIASHVEAHQEKLVALRRDLHRHPELSDREVRTAGVVAKELKSLGLDVRTGVGGHGVVGILKGARPGPLVAYRADMDAFPTGLPDPAPFPSEVPGVRHICGHDVHVAIGVGLASALASIRRDLPGRVMFIFQPAEERAAGARAMLDAGLFTTDKPVAVFGVHTAPLEVGRITSKAGLMMFPNAIAAGVTNDAALYESARRDLVAAMGEDAFVELHAPPAGFSEDFGEYQKLVPGVFFFLGLSRATRGIIAMPHSKGFDVDEAGMAFGIRAMAAVVLGRMTSEVILRVSKK
jgi:metal-dependent amidase/aminoacylase/carboxypeptidase family protein